MGGRQSETHRDLSFPAHLLLSPSSSTYSFSQSCCLLPLHVSLFVSRVTTQRPEQHDNPRPGWEILTRNLDAENPTAPCRRAALTFSAPLIEITSRNNPDNVPPKRKIAGEFGHTKGIFAQFPSCHTVTTLQAS